MQTQEDIQQEAEAQDDAGQEGLKRRKRKQRVTSLALTAEQEQTLKQWIPLCWKIARKYASRHGHDPEEYITEAMVGLVRAIQMLDPSKASMMTFAYKCIDNRLFRHSQVLRGIRSDGEPLFRKVPITHVDPKTFDYRAANDREGRTIAPYALETLTETERDIIRFRAEGLTYKQIGSRIGRTRQRVEQIISDLEERLLAA